MAVGVYVNTGDLVDSTDIADIAGWHGFRVVSQWRARHPAPDPRALPDPVVDKGRGRARLWRRQDIEAWQHQRVNR